MEFEFNLDIIYSHVAQALAGAGLLAALYLVFVYRRRIAAVVRHHRTTSRLAAEGTQRQIPALSVIIYCKDSARALERMLPEVLAQNLDVPFEVIVATDGRSEHAEDVVKLLSVEHKNLRMTYVPDEAHALSRKKLAVTLGIKAARYDYVVLTDANARIMSYDWLKLIGRHFADGKDVVIGSGFPDGERRLSGMDNFNMLADKVTYLSSAVKGRAYRGAECNMAFRRQLFFDNNGFTDSVGLHHGIDDIFLSHIVKRGNYAVELSGQAQVGMNVEALAGDYGLERVRHEFTGRRLSRCSRRLMGAGSLLMWVWLGVTVAAGVMFMPEVLPLAALLTVGAAWITLAGVAWCKAAKALHVPLRGWLVPVYMFVRPLTTFAMRLKGRMRRSANYTWAKPV
ncbi:MAG: glycosyltransferase [Muribaculaceae bacterium]|nr:glycosyltransferase [Muribaculaceae bacterium]